MSDSGPYELDGDAVGASTLPIQNPGCLCYDILVYFNLNQQNTLKLMYRTVWLIKAQNAKFFKGLNRLHPTWVLNWCHSTLCDCDGRQPSVGLTSLGQT